MNNLNTYQKAMTGRYEDTKIETLLVMLHEGLINKVKQAQERFDSGQTFKAKESLVRAMKIAYALMDNLNMEEGGETAINLEKLYSFIISEIADASHGTQTKEKLLNVIKITESLMEGWKGLEAKTP